MTDGRSQHLSGRTRRASGRLMTRDGAAETTPLPPSRKSGVQAKLTRKPSGALDAQDCLAPLSGTVPTANGNDGEDRDGPSTDLPPPISSLQNSGPRRATLTLMTGANAGEVFTLKGKAWELGRSQDATLFIRDTTVSRHHARIVRRSDGKYYIEDLQSSNGTYVGSRSVASCELASGDRVRLGHYTVFRFAITDASEEALQRKLYDASTRDPLTRVYNRRYLDDRLESEVSQARRKGSELAVLMVDIDHFKKINDAHGHQVGDMVLRSVATQMERHLRADDFVARYGGEEFVVTAKASGRSALILAERIRGAIERLEIPHEGTILKVTASLGVAEITEVGAGDESDTLIALADERLYRAKSDGRNRVCAAD